MQEEMITLYHLKNFYGNVKQKRNNKPQSAIQKSVSQEATDAQCGNQAGASRSQSASRAGNILTDLWIRSKSQQDAVLSHLSRRRWKVKRGWKRSKDETKLTALRGETKTQERRWKEEGQAIQRVARVVRHDRPVMGLPCWSLLFYNKNLTTNWKGSMAHVFNLCGAKHLKKNAECNVVQLQSWVLHIWQSFMLCRQRGISTADGPTSRLSPTSTRLPLIALSVPWVGAACCEPIRLRNNFRSCLDCAIQKSFPSALRNLE